jgi:hypothetical protein
MTSAGPFTFSQMELAMKLLAGGEIAIVSLMMGGESNQFAAGDLRALSADVVLPGAVIGELEKFYSRPMALIATAGADHGQDVVSAAGGLSYAGERGVPPGWHPQARTFQINASAAEAFSLGQALAQATLAPGGLNNVHLVATLPAGIVCNMVQGAAQCASSSATDAGPDRRTIQWQSGQLVPLSPYSVAAQNPAYPQATNF